MSDIIASAEITVTDVKDGVGIEGVITQFLATHLDKGVTTSTGNWLVNPPSMDVVNKYLWSYETITYTDGHKQDGKPAIIGVYGEDGVGIENIFEYYLVSNRNTGILSTDSRFESTIPTMDETNRYLWKYEEILYTNNERNSTSPVVVGVYGDKGTSIKNIKNYYLATSASSGITRDTDGFDETMKPLSLTNKYLWNYETIEYENPTSFQSTNPVIIGVHGEDGKDGEDAKLLYLSSTLETMSFNADGAASPTSQTATIEAKLQNISGSISFTAKAYNGTSALSNSIPLGGTGNSRTLSVSSFPSNATHVSITATLGSLTDTVSIFKLRHGQNAIVGYLTNESITLGANSSGLVGSFAPASGTFKMFDGTTEVTTSESTSYTLENSSGLVANINSSTGVYSITAMSADTATAEFKATYKGVIIFKTVTLSKSITGEKGDKGDPGSNAPTINLSGDSQMIKQDALGNVIPSTSFNITGVAVNTTITRWLFSVNGGAFGTGLTTGVTRSGNVVTVNPKTVTFNTLSIRAEDGTVTDTFTIGRAVDGEKGSKGDKGDEGLDGVDAITVVLTNESHTFAGDTTSAIAGSASTEFLAFKGANRASVTVGSITGMPEGMTRTIDINNSQNAKVTFNVTTAMKSRSGIVTIPLTVDGKIINKTFSYSLSLKGDKGDTGDTGTGVKSAVVAYRNHKSGTVTPPTTGWVENPPTPIKGQYMWTRTITTYTDNSNITTYSVAYNAIDGGDGKGITSTTVTYAISTSGSTTPTDWLPTRPTPDQGDYMWTRTLIKYTDGTESIAYNTSYSATDGQKGDKGDRGEKGATGDRGPIGPTGTSISDVVEYYLATSASSDVTTGTDGWKTTIQPMTPTEKYLWNYEVINFSDGSSSPTIPVIMGVYGDKGDTGGTGATGRSITAIQEYYLATSASKDVTRPNTDGTNGWTTTMQMTTPTNKYLWNYEKITWSSGTTTTYVEPIIIGVHGEKGDKGEVGADAKLLYLSASAEAMTFNSDNTPNPATQTITFTANMQNTTGTATFTAIPYNGATAMAAITLGGTGNIRTLTQKQFPATATSIQIKAVLGSLSDTVSVVKLKNGATGGTGAKGDTGATGAEGKNAIVGYLTNENITFPANSLGVVTSANLAMANGVFKVFDGLTEKTGSSITYSVVTQTGATGAITTAGAYSVSTISADNASITFRAIYSGVTIDKVLTLSKSKEGDKGDRGATGATGSIGPKGADGISISNIVEYYLISDKDFGVTIDTSGWNTTIPTMSPTQRFLWNYEKIEFSNETSEPTIPVIIGVYGQQGDTGAEGRAILGIQENYLVSSSSSGITRSSSGWDTVVKNPTPTEKYLWNYETITWSKAPLATYTNPIVIGVHGDKGDKGDNAPLVKLSGATQIITQSSTGTRTPSASFTVVGTSVNTTISAWTYSVNGGTFGTGLPTGVTRSGNTVTVAPGSITFNTLSIKATGGGVSDTFTIARIVDGDKGAKGDTGSTGGTGAAGKDGADAYTVLLSNESHTFQAGTTNAVAGSTTTDIHAYKGTNKVTVTVGTITGMPTGMTRTVIDSGTVNARITFTVATNMTSPSGTVIINLTVDNKPIVKQFSYALTFKGDTGAQGPQGATGSRGPIGNTGTSVESITEYYLATAVSSGIVSTNTGFTTAIQTMTATNKYLWNYEKINFSDGTDQPTIPVIIGVYGDKGQTGGTGATGATGRSIVSITEHYLATSANTGVIRTTAGFSTAMQPTTETNKYLWNYETITWSTAPLTTYVDPIIIGVHGAKGPQGTQGTQGIQGPKGATGSQGPTGATGTSVESITEYYLATSVSSGILSTNTGFKTTMQEMTATNKYLWNYEKINFSDNTSQPTIPVIIGVYGDKGQTGGTGATGATGRSIVSITEHYLATSANTGVTRSTSGWNTAMQPTTETNKYLWNYETITWSSGTTPTYVEPIIIGVHGAKGATGATGAAGAKGATGSQGPTGATGTSVESITEYYLATSASSGIVSTDTRFTTAIQTMTATNKYLWNYEKVNFSNNTSQPTIPVIIGVYGDKGQTGATGGTGATGATGRSITSITENYLATSASSGVTRSTSGWGTAMKTTDETNKYLWNYETINWSSGTTPTYVEPIIIGIHGAKGTTGATGSTGPKGATGPQGISPIVGFLTNESITLPASSAGAVSSFTGATGTFEVYDGTTRKTGSGIAYSVSGTPSGITVSINATTGVYTVSAMTTGTSVLSGTATLRAVYGGVTVDKILNVTKALAGTQGGTGATGATGGIGATGPAGQNATSYWTTSSVDTITMKYDGDYDPKVITFYGHSKTGTSNATTYAGRFIIQTSTNGTSYTQAYISSSNQSSYAFTVPSSVSFVKAKFYQAGGTTYLLDEQTVPVLRSAENLEFGGRNYFSTTRWMAQENRSSHYIAESDGSLSILAVDGMGADLYHTLADLMPNTEYVMSFSQPINDRFNLRNESNVNVQSLLWSWNSDSTELRFKTSATGVKIVGKFYPISQEYPVNVFIKIEKGNIATDWTEAPEDTELRNNKKTYNPVRYIRDWLNGSTANTGNHWGEIQAIQYSTGENIAKGKPVTSNGTLSNSTRVTDGAINTAYANGPAGYSYIQVDLGQVYYDIESFLVSHYYVDGRKYNQTKTEVSEDGVHWVPVFDSLIEGEYAETSAGKTFPNTKAKSESLIASQEVVNRLGDSTSNTTINGRNITTGRVQSKNSLSWLDLDTGHFNFGNGGLVYSGGTLALKGTLSVSDLTGTIPKSKLDTTLQTEVTAGANANTVVTANKSTWDTVTSKATPAQAQGYAGTAETNAKDYAKEQVDGIEVGGRNLLVQNTITRGRYLISTGGHTVSAAWFHTDYIPVTGYTKLITSGYTNLGNAPSVVYYNSNFAFVKGINNAGASRAKEITIDPGIAYIRFSGEIKDLPTLKIEKGNKATDWTSAPEDVESSIADVDEKATNANSSISDMMSDLKITPIEKTELSRSWERIKAEYAQLNSQASTLSVASATRTNYTNAYNALNGTTPRIQTDILASMTTNYNLTTATRDTFKAQMNAYFVQAETISKAITDKIQANANTAKSTAETASSTANTAKSTAETASSTANTAKSTADSASSTANTAKSAADTAKADASSAKTTASSAVSTANSASSTASTAKSTAETAKTAASNAQTTANAAKVTLDSKESIWDAKETIEGAKAKADAAAKAAEESAKKYVDDNTGNLVNNPAATGNHTGWSASGLSSLNQTFEGVSTRVLQSSIGSDTQNYSSYFKVDPSKAYEVSMWFKKSIANASGYYLGLNGINTSSSTVGFVQTNQAGGTVNANNTNFYFQSGTAPTDWVKVVGYIMPAGTIASDLKGVGTKDNAIMKPNIDRIRVRFLNWGNAGTARQLWVANPKVVEVDPNAVIYAAKAQDVADTAKSEASSAKTTASSAVSTANSASSTASSALSTANTANSNANTAKADASSAKSTASSASSTANTAKSTADTAKSTADTASSTANTANTTASNALTRVTIHDTRSNNQPPSWYFSNYARQIVQEFKNTSTMGIGTSLETYGILLTTVPWSGTSGGSIKQEFKVRDRMYTRDGSGASWTAWQDPVGTANTANSNANNAKAKTDAWTHPGTTLIGGDFVETGTMSADRIKARTITADRIATGVLTANEIAANAITAVKIASNAITAVKIASNAVTAGKISAGAVTAAKLDVGTLSAITANLGTVNAGILQGKNMNLNLDFGRFTSEDSVHSNIYGGYVNHKFEIMNSNISAEIRGSQNELLQDYQVTPYNIRYSKENADSVGARQWATFRLDEIGLYWSNGLGRSYMDKKGFETTEGAVIGDDVVIGGQVIVGDPSASYYNRTSITNTEIITKYINVGDGLSVNNYLYLDGSDVVYKSGDSYKGYFITYDGFAIAWEISAANTNWDWTYPTGFQYPPVVVAMGSGDARHWATSKTKTSARISSNVSTVKHGIAMGNVW